MTRAAVVVVVTIIAQAALHAAFPKYTGYVNDYTSVLSDPVRTELETLLRAVEAETKAEIAVAVVSSLDGMSVEEYANGLFKEWGVGKEDLDNGVLVVVAPSEREMRIEVGYGLEPVLPDGLAGEIIRTNFLPRFRNDDYAGGITEGVTRVAEVVRRNHVLSPEERAALEQSDQAAEVPIWITVPFFGMFVSIGFFMSGVGIGSKTVFPLLFGSFFGGMPLMMSLLFGAPAYILGPLAIAAFTYGFRSGRRKPAWVAAMRASGGRRSASSRGWVMGAGSSGSGGSSSGSSSSSSSSSSFGGGSSGGGGASGRW
jgi:uncharacterized protein